MPDQASIRRIVSTSTSTTDFQYTKNIKHADDEIFSCVSSCKKIIKGERAQFCKVTVKKEGAINFLWLTVYI